MTMPKRVKRRENVLIAKVIMCCWTASLSRTKTKKNGESSLAKREFASNA